ncbi:DUF1501 domain-containing protein [Zavarzinella formosa]|uniref:DUF1501 domain-containing protein n=1 Tax=Zavarzinella formosa TaxID=360055 RepID=UPI0002DB02B8|nr:DUF1501 domain-containing protein [Zavarzinella formosa]
MLSFLGKRQTFCDGLHRRNFLKLGAFGTGLTLADMLRLQATAAPSNSLSSSGRPKSAIMVYLPGGPSHMDMYDLKPDAPSEFRGEFKPINTNVSGIQISEHFPMQAKMMDKMSIVRSLVANDEHSDSYVMTGFTEQVNRAAVQGQHPSFGSVMSRVRAGQSDIPPFVSLRGMSIGCEPGFLGVAHRAFTSEGTGLDNLRLRNGAAAKLDDRKNLLTSFDTIRRDIDKGTTMGGMDAFTGRAFDMISTGTVHKALDLKNEDPRVLDRYKNVEMFLKARRLVEAGVGCVTLSYGGWDTHSANFTTLKKQLPELDRGIANLIQDLHDRGMEDDVVTIVWGEFGRTPKINSSEAGRDHWSPAMSALVAGGGLKMGQVVGSTNARGEHPKDRPYKVPQMLATLYQAIGIDPSMTFQNGTGRPMYILDNRDPVSELL